MICPLCGGAFPGKPKVYQEGRRVLYLCEMCYAQKMLKHQPSLPRPKISFWSAFFKALKRLFRPR